MIETLPYIIESSAIIFTGIILFFTISLEIKRHHLERISKLPLWASRISAEKKVDKNELSTMKLLCLVCTFLIVTILSATAGFESEFFRSITPTLFIFSMLFMLGALIKIFDFMRIKI